MKSLLPVMLAVIGLSGCVATEDAWLAANVAPDGKAAGHGNREIAPHLALANVTGLRETPVSVRNLSSEGTTIQQIVYPTRSLAAGENLLVIEKGSASVSRLRQTPSPASLASEMRRALPGLVMVREPSLRHNAYGPYGVAIGASKEAGTCVYAWQKISPWPGSAKTFGSGDAATVRLRYCDPKADTALLASLLATLSLDPGSSPYPAYAEMAPALPQQVGTYGYVSAPSTTSDASPIVKDPVKVAETIAQPSAESPTAATSASNSVAVPLPED